MLHPGGGDAAGGGGSLAHHYSQHHNMHPRSLHNSHHRQHPEHGAPGSPGLPAACPLPAHPLPHHFLLPEDDEGLAADEAGPPALRDGEERRHYQEAAFQHRHLAPPQPQQLLTQLSHAAHRHGSGHFGERCACSGSLCGLPHQPALLLCRTEAESNMRLDSRYSGDGHGRGGGVRTEPG